jgi:DNA-binding response OmpR family regulator
MQQRTRSTGARRRPAFLVEDDALALSLLRDLAEGVGLEPRTFTSLAAARRALRAGVPAVLVVDDDLPDGSGADFVRELRADPRTRRVRVLFCTAADDRRRREIATLAPVVAKPFELREMERALAEVAYG